MPELPEVETIRRQLAQEIVGKRLNGKLITGVRRRAKLLIIDFKKDGSLLFHLKLTGQLIFNGKPSAHTRRVFYFNDGTNLIFNDVRKFGWWKRVKDTSKIEKEFGPEAPDVDPSTFKDMVKKHPKVKIKSLLMNQKVISGIGNIYSDEILFAAKINPLRKASSLDKQEIRQICLNIKKILAKAIKLRGTTSQDYLDVYGRTGGYFSHLKVYGKEGEKCYRCQGLVKRVKIGGRSAHFCPNCQL